MRCAYRPGVQILSNGKFSSENMGKYGKLALKVWEIRKVDVADSAMAAAALHRAH